MTPLQMGLWQSIQVLRTLPYHENNVFSMDIKNALIEIADKCQEDYDVICSTAVRKIPKAMLDLQNNLFAYEKVYANNNGNMELFNIEIDKISNVFSGKSKRVFNLVDKMFIKRK